MVHCMVSPHDAPGRALPGKGRGYLRTLSPTMKKNVAFYAETVEQVKHIRSRLRYGAVVEGEVDRRMPRLSRIEPELSGSGKSAEYRRGDSIILTSTDAWPQTRR